MKLELDSPALGKAEGAADLVIAGFLWLLCSVPVVTIGAASAALYYTVVKVCRRKRGTVVRSFFHSFRQNFRQGIFFSIGYLVYLAVLGFTFFTFFHSAEKGNYGIFLAGVVLAMPFLFTLPYIFPVLSRFGGSMGKLLQYAFHMSVGHFPTTIVLLVLGSMVISLCVFIPFCLILLPGVYALLSSFLLERILKRYVIVEKKAGEDGGEIPWYLE